MERGSDEWKMTISILICKDNSVPLYMQIYRQIRQHILQGDILPGARLPASRRLATDCNVARITVTEAYHQLQAEGYIESRLGAGTFVVDALPISESNFEQQTIFKPRFSNWGSQVLIAGQKAKRPFRSRPPIDFGFGRSFPHIFPYDIWRQLLARYLSTDDVMLSRYGSVAGFYPLREALADYLQRLRGVHCHPKQVVIVSGAQQALDILSRLLLQPGDEVLMETPGYTDAYSIFRLHDAQVTLLPVDAAGLPVEKIPPTSQPRMLFLTPSNQFPHGGTMPLAQRLALLQWAHQKDALLIEDDYDGELRYNGRPLSALQGLDTEGRVVYLGTFSKVLFPALRLGYIVLPQSLVNPFLQAKALVDKGAPTLTQAAVSDFITEGHFERHLRHLRQAYGQRRNVLVNALERYLHGKVTYSPFAAGLHVMVYLQQSCNEAQLVRRAAEAGIGIYPGEEYHLKKPAPPSIMLGFSGLNEDDIEEGVRRLANIIKNEE